MKTSKKMFWIGLTTVAAGGAVLLSLGAGADWDEHRWSAWGQRADFAPVADQAYVSECGGCHMAYQPGMLPAESWRRIMGNLQDHFGDNAELDEPIRQHILGVLERNAADRVSSGRSPGVARSLSGRAPLRFTETRYFRRKHHEIPARIVEQNPQVGSFANCDACHAGAKKGSYDEHQVRISGVGYWDD